MRTARERVCLVLLGSQALCYIPTETQYTTIQCVTGTSWENNDLGQSPCELWGRFLAICAVPDGTWAGPVGYLADPSVPYGPPGTAGPPGPDACSCSTPFYNLVSACAWCQGARVWITEDKWKSVCPSYTEGGISPNVSTAGLDIPSWAFLSPNGGSWDPIQAEEYIASGGSTSTTLSTTAMFTSSDGTSSPTTTSGGQDGGNPGGSNMGTIIGAVVGGVVGLVILVLLALFLLRKRLWPSSRAGHAVDLAEGPDEKDTLMSRPLSALPQGSTPIPYLYEHSTPGIGYEGAPPMTPLVSPVSSPIPARTLHPWGQALQADSKTRFPYHSGASAGAGVGSGSIPSSLTRPIHLADRSSEPWSPSGATVGIGSEVGSSWLPGT